MEKMPGETDVGWFQRLASRERAAARVWRELGETELALQCDQLAVVYQQSCEMYQEAERW